MERILQSFKDLYKCEDVVKRHLFYAALMILPGMLGVMRFFLDKDTPKELLPICLIVTGIIFVLAIIPMLFNFGVWVDFINDRLQQRSGIPQINMESLKKGLAYFPLTFVWGLYFSLIFGLLFIVPMLGFIFNLLGNKNSDPLFAVGGFLILFLLFLLALVLVFILAPFYNYVAIKYVKLGHYTSDMFNPFIVIDYMKMAFKSTMMVMLKMILASFIVNLVSGMVTGVITFIIIMITMVAIMLSGDTNATLAMYSPGVILIVVPLGTLCGVIQAYTTGMVGFAAADNYIDVYKKEIEPNED